MSVDRPGTFGGEPTPACSKCPSPLEIPRGLDYNTRPLERASARCHSTDVLQFRLGYTGPGIGHWRRWESLADSPLRVV